MKHYQTDVAVIGAGLAGIVTALELLDCGYSVALLDGSPDGALGGQANDAFGGMLLTGTAEQARNRIKDSPELLLEDWLRAGEFDAEDHWPRAWAALYAEQCTPMIYQWLIAHGIRFFPSVQWVERGLHGNGNSLPRYHIAWGCGRGIASTLADALTQHPKAANLQILRGHRVESFEQNASGISGCMGVTDYYLTATNTNTEQLQFTVTADNTVVCSGGINGNLEKVRQNWDACYGPPPPNLLAGSSPDADGKMHDQVQSLGGQITHLNHMWNYAAGVAHPKARFPEHGLSLIPARSALWLDRHGRRIGPMPLVTGFDTHDLCKTVGNLPGQYSWQVMNYRIAVRELAASGTDANPDFRDKKLLRIIWHALRGGDPKLTDWLIKKCPDVISAENPTELIGRMNALTGSNDIDRDGMLADIRAYDTNIARGKKLHNDDQIRRLQQLRQWTPDRMRTCNMLQILDPKAGPLIAIRERLISRKSLGGIQTDTCSRVLSKNGSPIPGLYAAGEAAGFGGGGISGIRSLEGTFLSNCILNGRRAAQSIAGKIEIVIS